MLQGCVLCRGFPSHSNVFQGAIVHRVVVDGEGTLVAMNMSIEDQVNSIPRFSKNSGYPGLSRAIHTENHVPVHVPTTHWTENWSGQHE